MELLTDSGTDHGESCTGREKVPVQEILSSEGSAKNRVGCGQTGKRRGQNVEHPLFSGAHILLETKGTFVLGLEQRGSL